MTSVRRERSGRFAPPPPITSSAVRGRRGRRRVFWVLAVVVLLTAGGVVGVVLRRSTTACDVPPVTDRELTRLASFQQWLTTNDVRGYIGEVGWPSTDATNWNAVARSWFGAAAADRLWVTSWSASSWWPSTYPMSIYRFDGNGGATVGPQAAVTRAYAAPAGALNGIDLPSGSFGTAQDGDPTYSNGNPGRFNVDYTYDTADDYRYLSHLGYTLARVSFTWERLQPEPGGPLDPTAVQHLIDTVTAASTAGIGVILDLHNFGGYWVPGADGPSRRLAIGSAELPTSALADFWGRLATAMKDVPGVAGYGLMNEPGNLDPEPSVGARVWERASQEAVDAIRTAHDNRTVLVDAYGSSTPESFAQQHPKAWIKDRADAVRYDAHQYFDSDGSGRYALSYSGETANARDALAQQSDGTTTAPPRQENAAANCRGTTGTQ